jgi:ABC-2 type transport system ATP-binding protein
MKQKLALARAVMHHPRLVFLDEPTAGLDVVAAAAVRDDLARMATREGVTVFLTTHNMSEAEKLCTSVAVIRRGKLAAIGHPDELRQRASRPQLEVVGRGFGENAIRLLRARPEVRAAKTQNGHLSIELVSEVDIASLVSLLASAGAQVEEVRKVRATLEEVLVTLMEEKG